jgi:hypothetical protein
MIKSAPDMTNSRKTITEIKAEERRQERAENRLKFFERLWGIFKFLLVMTILVLAFNHRVKIGKICHAAFDDVMKHVTLPQQVRQKTSDYQQQIDGITTN